MSLVWLHGTVREWLLCASWTACVHLAEGEAEERSRWGGCDGVVMRDTLVFAVLLDDATRKARLAYFYPFHNVSHAYRGTHWSDDL